VSQGSQHLPLLTGATVPSLGGAGMALVKVLLKASCLSAIAIVPHWYRSVVYCADGDGVVRMREVCLTPV
jgi:hypothetical protein